MSVQYRRFPDFKLQGIGRRLLTRTTVADFFPKEAAKINDLFQIQDTPIKTIKGN